MSIVREKKYKGKLLKISVWINYREWMTGPDWPPRLCARARNVRATATDIARQLVGGHHRGLAAFPFTIAMSRLINDLACH
ncbi:MULTISPECIES: hypothetical protein [unclassified Caballeronia]|uniref:hypothetical protein n=1 Tax=unclassified Caballeronia TaxID=2646786 RepID=UPI0020293B75|nr:MULTISPECIES: hypothetical protein [unclassified Caballeronia]